jgi:hypothetical protein
VGEGKCRALLARIRTRIAEHQVAAKQVGGGEANTAPETRPLTNPLPWTFEGLGAGEHVAMTKYELITSANGVFIAAAFSGTGRSLGTGDDTPGHIRVWDRRSHSLQAWSGESPMWEMHRTCPRAFEFIANGRDLLYADVAGVHVVDLSTRRVIATWPADLSRLGVYELTWFPRARMMSVEGEDRFTLIRVRD